MVLFGVCVIWDELNQGSDKNRSEMGHLSSDGEKLTIARVIFYTERAFSEFVWFETRCTGAPER